MTALRPTVQFTDGGEAADLAAFLTRLIHYDRAAAVRLRAAGTTLAVFGRPPSFEVLAIRTARLAKPFEDGLDHTLDVTVSAGDLLESIDERAATAAVPGAVTGPPWAGVLPPRDGWRQQPGLPGPGPLCGIVAGAVAEFRRRTAQLSPERRTRAELDRIGHDIWHRPVADTDLPVRAAHAAHALGFLRDTSRSAAVVTTPAAVDTAPGTAEPPTDESARAGAPAPVALFASGAWLRLRTPYGSIAVRRSGTARLSLTPA
jgi:hypothetical protein